MTMGVASTVHYFYPQLVPVAGPKGGIEDPQPVRCSRDKLSEDSAFILENGIYIFMWIGASVCPDWLQSIFGVSNLGQLNVEALTELPDHVNSDESLRLRAFIRSLRTERQRHMRLTMVRQRDKMELVMNRFLVEDRGTDGQPSYVDFLCHMHKEIRSLLNQ
jgi:protein transport protein SEC24